jgi:hypothetical protein
VAIKGKTKRSQGRPVRRPATGPRVQAAERRLPWYRAPAFPATLAVIALLATLFAAYSRVQEGWSRDDVRRFTAAIRAQTDQLPAVLGQGTKQLPGFARAEDATTGKATPKDLKVWASGWSAKLDQMKSDVEAITIGEVPAQSEFNGKPLNSVGGRVPMLTSVRDEYAAAIGVYVEAANTFTQAADAPAKSTLAKALVQQANGTAAKGGAAMDAAAGALARIYDRYDLDLTRQLPGESAEAFGARYQPAGQQPQGTLPPN